MFLNLSSKICQNYEGRAEYYTIYFSAAVLECPHPSNELVNCLTDILKQLLLKPERNLVKERGLYIRDMLKICFS